MSDYYCTTRTNYFRVKDESKFREIMSLVRGDECDVSLWDDRVDNSGNKLFGFGCYGFIYGIFDEDDEYDDGAYDRFLRLLKTCVADDDAIIIFESGHEKLRYVCGDAVIVTSSEIASVDLTYQAIDKAREMLGKTDWTSRCEY